MATVKNVKVRTIRWRGRGYYWTDDIFKTFTDDNGNKTYYINGNEVSMEAGNAEYLRIRECNREYQQTQDCKDYIKHQWAQYYRAKRRGRDTSGYCLHEADTFKQTVEEYETSYEEIIEKLEKSYDHYTQYIDDYKQMVQAEESNRRILEEIAKYKKLIAER